MNSKTILILPGSFWQIPIIQKSKSMGYRTLVVNPYENSPAFSYVDGYLKSDIFDVKKVLHYCKTEKVDAIVSDECDVAMPLVATLGKCMSLPTIDEKSAHLFTDKSKMRDFCYIHKIPSPKYCLCKTIKEVEEFYDNLEKNIIIKPLDSNSSRGISIINHKSEIQECFDKALSYSKVQKAVLAEEYIDGPEFTVDGIKTPEKHFTLAISEKKHFNSNPNVACELYFTRNNEKYDYNMLALQNDLFVNQSSLQFGLTHAEYKYKNGKFYLIEIAARGGGNLISSHIVPFLSGIDNYEYLLHCSLGNITSPDFKIKEQYNKRCAVLSFFEPPKNGGIVERIEGKEFLEIHPKIKEYRFNFKIGDLLIDASIDAERAGYYIACCDTKKELDKLMQLVKEKVKIICR